MKIQIFSDLHIEFAPFKPPPTDADIVVLAGDIHLGLRGLEWAKQAFPEQTVIYVLGNHEYYSNAMPKLTNKLREQAADSQVHVLENERLEIDGVKFLGCTLWTNFKLFGQAPIAAFHAQQWMMDYQKIRISPQFHKLRPNHTASFHAQSLQWLQNEFKQSQQTQHKTVVITHHAPSIKSIAPHYRSDLLSAAFASPLDDLVINSGAKLWIHGHCHDSFDYQLGDTRIICNPRGYPNEMQFNFNPKLVIEV